MSLLDRPADRDRALAVAAGIADAICADGAERDDDALADDASAGRGAAGIAVFLATCATATGEQRYAEHALAFLDRALDRAAEDRPSGSLYGGTLGVGWALDHLEGRLLEAGDGADDVDELAAALVDGGGWPSFDLIRGLVGAGVYLLGRLPRPQAAKGLARVVERLGETATARLPGLAWWTDPATMMPERAAAYPQGFYDVGLAHGQAGVVAMLAHAHAAGVAGAQELLEPATRWLRAQRQPGGFPAFVTDGERTPARVAWCYGDAGVALALQAAAEALDDEELRGETRDVAVAAAARSDPGVVDAGLCHGSAGLMHVFGRLAATTGDERLRDAGIHWYEDLLARRDQALPFGGFPRWETEGMTAKAGLLEGSAGVGLALLAAAGDGDEGWDMLLLAAPVSPR